MKNRFWHFIVSPFGPHSPGGQTQIVRLSTWITTPDASSINQTRATNTYTPCGPVTLYGTYRPPPHHHHFTLFSPFYGIHFTGLFNWSVALF